MAVRIRMKKMGRRHRPYFRICAVDSRQPRDGRVIEELGTYDPMVPDTDARVTMNNERVTYWLGVGAQPSDKVGVLIKKYGPEGTHLAQQSAARDRLAAPKTLPDVGPPAYAPEPPKPAAPPAEEAPAPAAEAPTEEAPAAEAPAKESAAAETETQDAPAETTEVTETEEKSE